MWKIKIKLFTENRNMAEYITIVDHRLMFIKTGALPIFVPCKRPLS